MCIIKNFRIRSSERQEGGNTCRCPEETQLQNKPVRCSGGLRPPSGTIRRDRLRRSVANQAGWYRHRISEPPPRRKWDGRSPCLRATITDRLEPGPSDAQIYGPTGPVPPGRLAIASWAQRTSFILSIGPRMLSRKSMMTRRLRILIFALTDIPD